MGLSDIVITKIVAVNRMNDAVGTYSTKNRQQYGLCYKYAGRTTYIHNGKSYTNDSDHITFIPKGSSFQYMREEQGGCIIVEFLAEHAGDEFETFVINNGAEILSILTKLERAFTFKKPGYMAYCMSALYKLLFSVIAQNGNPYLAKIKKHRIQPGVEYLENHYNDCNLNIQQLANVSGVSEVYFRKMFTEIYGIPPKKYINLIRITKAKELLLSDEISMQQISEEVGFHDVYSFCKAFRKANDCTPTEYRKNHTNSL